MKFKGNGDKWLILTVSIVTIFAAAFSGNRIQLVGLLVLWLTYYGLFVWIREVEVTKDEIILKRLIRNTTVRKREITDVDFKKRSIMIFKGNYAGLSLYKGQIDKADREKLVDYLKQFKAI